MKKVVLKLPYDQKSFILCGSEHDRSILGPIEENGCYETHVMNVLKKIIQPNHICLDIGANIGAISLALSDLAREGKVYSFEPSNTNFSFLVQNIAENHISNMEAINMGAYDRNINVNFCEIGDGGGWSFVYNETTKHTPSHMAACVKLDDWVKERGIAKIDFIKMDIEGAELKALNGALSMIHEWHPDLIVEFNPEALSVLSGDNPPDLYFLLQGLYPHIYLIKRDDSIVKVNNYPQLLELIQPWHGDLYCTFKPE